MGRAAAARHPGRARGGGSAQRTGPPAPVAYLRRAGGAYCLELAPAPESDAPEVSVNGERLQKTLPLRFADEIQVRIPRPEGPRAVRFSFERYSEAVGTV